MAAAHDFAVYKDVLILLGTAAVVVPVMHRWRVSPVLGFLGAGVLLGPSGLGALSASLPPLAWITLSDEASIAGIAELGVVFLLFMVGLELSLERLLALRRLVFGMGGLHVLLSALAIGGVAGLHGNDLAVCLVIGTSLALSSTAIVLEVLAGKKRMASQAGRASFAVLLFQDLAVVPLLFLVGILGAGGEGSILIGLLLALAQAAAAIGVILVVGRFGLRPLFRQVASTDSPELFMAASIFVAVGTGVASAAAGLSMALGAFLAGLLLAETEYRRAIETTIEPFKGLLLGVFFFSIGMQLDLQAVARDPLWLLASVVGLVAVKGGLLVVLARLFGIGLPAAVESALLLGPAGEFAFVIIGLALSLGLMSAEVAGFMLMMTSLSMVAIPFLGHAGQALAARLEPPPSLDPDLPVAPAEGGGPNVLVVGHGRVGRLVCDLLDRHGIAYLASDKNAYAVARWHKAGRNIVYGDATRPDFLKICGLAEAPALLVTIHTDAAIEEIVQAARALRSDLVIMARARDSDQARRLYEQGATDAAPEMVEASLQLAEAALLRLGVSAEEASQSVHEKRAEVRRELRGD